MRWFVSALVLLVLVALPSSFFFRTYLSSEQPLPTVNEFPGGMVPPCDDALRQARYLATAEPTEARLAYLWMLTRCSSAPELADALIEFAALSAYRLEKPDEARKAYRKFLALFPEHSGNQDVLMQLGKLELDDGDFPAAVGYLRKLIERYPNSDHDESASVLAARAEEAIAAERDQTQTVAGRFRDVVPNNVKSAFALLIAILPFSVMHIRHYVSGDRTSGSLVLLLLVLTCLVSSFFWNLSERSNEIKRLETEMASIRAEIE